MRTIRELNSTDKEYIRELAALHRRAFPDFFLTQLGEPFLQVLYKGYLEDRQSGIIVAEENNNIIGFIAYSYDYPGFYKGLLKRKIVQFAWHSFWAAVRRPSFIKRLLGAFKKSETVVKNERYVELASICVDPHVERMGIGSKLIDYLKNKVDYKTYSYINLETDEKNNENAIKFYEKNGFIKERQFVTPEGRSMIEFRYWG